MGGRGSSSSNRVSFGQYIKAQKTGDKKTIRQFNNQRIADLRNRIKNGTQPLGVYNEIERLQNQNRNLK